MTALGTGSTEPAPAELRRAAAVPAVARGATLPRCSPNQRAWARFRRNRIGYVSLWIFALLLLVSTCAELVSNDRPLVARYDGHWFFPVFYNPPEKALRRRLRDADRLERSADRASSSASPATGPCSR